MIFNKQRIKLLSDVVDLRQKEKIVARWPDMVAATGKSAAKFCKAHGIPPESYSRWINGVWLPGWDVINNVQAAFIKEGVLK